MSSIPEPVETISPPSYIPTPEQVGEDILEKLAEPCPFLEGVNLPVVEVQEKIKNMIAFKSGSVFVAETGAGKSLAIPFLADQVVQTLGLKGIVGVTQPRNLATRQGAKNLAGLAHCELGEKIGYHVGEGAGAGENIKESPQTDILTMTERILVNEWERGDRTLSRYSVVIVDEAHEGGKDLNYVLLALKMANAERERRGIEPIRIVITSATIPTKKFTDYLEYNPINPAKKDKVDHMEISGRSNKIEISYAKRELRKDEDFTLVAAEKALKKIREFDAAGDDGNIIVFMPGKGECDNTIAHLKRLLGPEANNYDILPAYREESQGEYSKIFDSEGTKRKIIVGTNLLETSVTIKNTAHVINTGQEKEMQYDPVIGKDKLTPKASTQSSNTQRAGRAGRDRDGTCDNLFTEKNSKNREKYPTAELLRTHLGPTILELSRLGIRDLRNVRLLDQPNPEDLEIAIQDLKILGAMDEHENLTTEGELMAKIGGKPEHARMLVEAFKHGCVKSIAVAIAFASMTSSIMNRSQDREEQKAIRTAQHRVVDMSSDYLTFIKIWEQFENNGKTEEWAQAHQLDYRFLQGISGALNNVAKSLRGAKIPLNNSRGFTAATPSESEESVGKSIAAGLVGTLMKQTSGNTFSRFYLRSPNGKPDQIQIDRSSKIALANVRSDHYLVGELNSYKGKDGQVNVTVQYGQVVPRRWLPEIAPQLCEEREIYAFADRSGHSVIKTRAIMLKGTNDVISTVSTETLSGEALTRDVMRRATARGITTGEIPFPPNRRNVQTMRQANSFWSRLFGRRQ